MDYMLKKQVQLKEGVDNIMGGKVLPLPSDVLREAESKGKIQVRLGVLAARCASCFA